MLSVALALALGTTMAASIVTVANAGNDGLDVDVCIFVDAKGHCH
jgi:hypothetical protein